MTTPEINRAIAELLGRYSNYPEDLNAMHEVECTLTSHEQLDYMEFLSPPILSWHTETWELTHATARQRAEAFLRVKGKWND